MDLKVLTIFLGTLSCINCANNNIINFISEDEISELKFLNWSVNPCDDFYEFTCGNYKNIHPRPEDKLVIDNFLLLQNNIIKTVHQILKSPAFNKDPISVKKAKAAYRACINTNYANKIKNPEESVIQEVHGFPLVEEPVIFSKAVFDWRDVARLEAKYGMRLLFDIFTQANPMDNQKMLLVFDSLSSGSFTPSLNSIEIEDSLEKIIDKSLLNWAQMAGTYKLQKDPFDFLIRNITMKLKNSGKRPGVDDKTIERNINELRLFINKLANGGIVEPNAIIPNITEPVRVNVTIEEVQRWTDNFGQRFQVNWLDYTKTLLNISGVEITNHSEILCHTQFPNLTYGIMNLISQTRPAILKSYALIRVFLHNAADSDADTRSALEQFYKEVNQKNFERWEYCTRKIADLSGTLSLSLAAVHEYERYWFNINKLKLAEKMIFDIKSVISDLAQVVGWMDETSKQKSLLKIDNIITSLAYPEMVDNSTQLDEFYENLRICDWDNYGNSYRLRAFKLALQLVDLDKTRDRTSWTKSPFTVNAFYVRQNNQIVFPIAILNEVFFTDKENLSILNYGRIGSIIGHEITHGFDQVGSYYDENGDMSLLWTPQTIAQFRNLSKCYIEQYNSYYVPEINATINGARTNNENIADNGGLKIAYYAMKKLEQREGSTITRKFNSDQLFFIALGTEWCEDASKEYWLKMINNEHTISKWRVNGMVSNFEPFAKAFRCPRGSKMNPEKKCKIW